MPRTDLFIKVQIEHPSDEPPERLAGEICRRIVKVYGVVKAELSTAVPHTE
jgi:hypothetical protein